MTDKQSKKKIMSLGDLVLDIIIPVTFLIMAEDHQAISYQRIEPGGSGNFMIAATRVGADVIAVGAVGDDLFGQNIKQLLEREKIDVTHIYTRPTSVSTVVLALTDQTTSKHTFIGHYGRGSEVSYPDDLDTTIEEADALFFQGYTLNERDIVSLTIRAVEHANRSNIPVYFDAGPLIEKVPIQHKQWITETCDVIMMTEDEAKLFARDLRGTTDYRFLLEKRPNMLVIKQGDQGCTIITAESEKSFPAFPVRVVDTVGAGDCFNAAFIAMQLEGRPIDESATIANAMGAAATTKIIAGRQAPNCKEVNIILAKAKSEYRVTC